MKSKTNLSTDTFYVRQQKGVKHEGYNTKQKVTRRSDLFTSRQELFRSTLDLKGIECSDGSIQEERSSEKGGEI